MFSAGCAACREAVELVERVAGTTHKVEVLDMHRPDVAAILDALREGPLTVGEIVEATGLAQPNVSKANAGSW